MANAPGKSFRKGLSIIEIIDMFPDEETARKWFESIVWKDGRVCPHCGSVHTVECKGKPPMPYWCNGCGKHFSVRKGTVMEGSPLPFRKWVMAIYLHMTSLKDVSSMKLHRDIKVTQKTAWFMLQRIRETFKRDDDDDPMSGPVEVDETYVGGREANKHKSKKLNADRGGGGKSVVTAIKDRHTWEIRAKVISDQKSETLQGFVHANTDRDSTVYTDEHSGYVGLDRDHGTVCHSVSEFVREMAAFYVRFRERGKCHKVAVTAVMRKPVVTVNVPLRDRRVWEDRTADASA